MKLPGGEVRRLKKIALKAYLACGLTLCLSGCRHRPQLAPLPPVLSPVDLVEVPPMENPPMIDNPQVKLPPVPSASAAMNPRRRRRSSPPKATAATVTPPVTTPAATQPAAADPPAEVATIGALTAGGEANPQSKQEAADLIVSIEKRLNGMPTKMAEDQKAQTSKVRNFLRDAQDALKSGDAEGAKTLATKAKLLLDDMEK